MKHVIVLLSAATILIAATSCKKNKVAASPDMSTETRTVGNYDRVVLEDALSADFNFTSGTEEIVVEANSNIHEFIVTEVIGGTLYIKRRDNTQIAGPHTIRIHVYAHDFNSMDISGASSCVLNNTWSNAYIDLNLSGASSMNGSVNTSDLSVELSGASSAELTGSSANCVLDLSGASNFEHTGFACNVLRAGLSGASHARLTVNQELYLNLSGASSLEYAGNGSIKTMESTGGSSIIHL